MVEEEAPRPSPPTRTSASRTTDWKVKYSPQKEEQTYRPAEPWRGNQVSEQLHRNVTGSTVYLSVNRKHAYYRY